MQFKLCLLLLGITFALCKDIKDEQTCVDYFKTGENFNLTDIVGEWYTVYYWPPMQRTRTKCGTMSFKKVERTFSPLQKCISKIPESEPIYKCFYKNTAGRLMNVYYFGSEEVKSQLRGCEVTSGKMSKFIFTDLGDGYVMGISCSSAGRGVLLSKSLPTASEVQAKVDDIEVMKGRQGSPDCKLSE
ncbi:uncharacterized protein LOC121736929 [Aricia agestis]|uniref:uncharacterized protein LOC121736929 n=1 Tax=Aricia agestis TaxID=91739 RepID=UPI001C20AFD8|nr:uncharacterized protein LOC121736929 [Aricia agestis]